MVDVDSPQVSMSGHMALYSGLQDTGDGYDIYTDTGSVVQDERPLLHQAAVVVDADQASIAQLRSSLCIAASAK